jgi:hypothetical protein
MISEELRLKIIDKCILLILAREISNFFAPIVDRDQLSHDVLNPAHVPY